MRGLWLEYMRSGIFGYLLYLCVFEIVYFHSCIDKYNIKKMWTCAPVLVVAWSDTFVRSLSRTTRASLTRNWPGFPWKWGHFIRDTSSRPHLSRPGTRLLWNIVEPTLYTFNTVKLLHCSDEGCCCDWKKDRERRKFACILWKTFYPPILLFSETLALILLFFLTFLISGKAVTFTSFFQRHNSCWKFVQYGLKTVCCHWKWWTNWYN